MPYLTLLLIICCAVFYYRVGEQEYSSGGLLALTSVVLWALGILVFRFRWMKVAEAYDKPIIKDSHSGLGSFNTLMARSSYHLSA